MSKEEYLNQLHKYLRKLPKQDYDDAMDYFEEYFQETDEAGAQKLIEEMGTPKEAARELIANLLDKKLDETYMSDENNDRMGTSGKQSSKGGTFWVACLAILALPVGAPLLLVILAVFGLCFGLCGNCPRVCIHFCNLFASCRRKVMDPWIVCNYNICIRICNGQRMRFVCVRNWYFTCDTYDLSL